MFDSPARAAVVTGGARGIGAATARRLGADGFAVAVLDLESADDTVASIESRGGSAIGITCNVTDRKSIELAMDEVITRLGGLHVLVNNAGLTRDGPLASVNDDAWSTVIDANLTGTYLCTQTAQRTMVDQRYGRIVCLSSTAARGSPNQASYAAAKAGVQGLSHTLAKELGPFGITSNVVAPGFIDTNITRAAAARSGTDVESYKRAAIANIPVGRVGAPEDVAACISFLCSEESGYVNGQVIYVDGGRG